MDKPYIVDINKLQEDLREVFKAHGWDPADAYELAMEATKMAMTAE